MGQSFLSMFAYAKINLALAIRGVQENGYHELQSVMQSIELHDIVRVRRGGDKVVCHCGTLSGPRNIAYKVAVSFLQQIGQSEGIEIEIEKRIPIQAGLAGGSADAAATLRLMNQLYGNPLNEDELLALAGQSGADVAFCLHGGTMWATGRGEILESMPPAPEIHLILLKPFAGVNTGEAYRRFDESGTVGHLVRSVWDNALRLGSTTIIADLLYNDLEAVSTQLVPDIEKFKQYLLEEQCYGALMSGSGSSVFGIARGEQHALEVAERMRRKGIKNVWLTKTLTDPVK